MDPNSHNWPAALPPGFTYGRSVVGVPGTWRPDNASQLPGSPTLPGSTGVQPPERIRLRIFDLVFENWLPFTWTIASRFIGPAKQEAPWRSPVDVNVAESITRAGTFPSSERPFPAPYMIGAISNFMPMLDQLSMQWAWGKTPSGPGVLTPVPVPFDTTYPTLTKVTG